MPRLYREAPVNSIWEGSGSVNALDVLRAADRDPEAIQALFDEVSRARGGNAQLDRAARELRDGLGDPAKREERARHLAERIVLVLQGALLVQRAPAEIADAFCRSRLGGEWGRTFGTLSPGTDFGRILERARAADVE